MNQHNIRRVTLSTSTSKTLVPADRSWEGFPYNSTIPAYAHASKTHLFVLEVPYCPGGFSLCPARTFHTPWELQSPFHLSWRLYAYHKRSIGAGWAGKVFMQTQQVLGGKTKGNDSQGSIRLTSPLYSQINSSGRDNSLKTIPDVQNQPRIAYYSKRRER